MTEEQFKNLNINSYVYKHISYTDEIKIYRYKGINKNSFAIIQGISGFDDTRIKPIKDFINKFFLSEKECKINFIKEEYKLFMERIIALNTTIEKHKEYLNKETQEFEGLKIKYKDFMKENAEYFI